MGKKIVVAGHICLDITPGFKESHKMPVNELLIPGKLINIEGAYIQPGGVVANAGLALLKLGADAVLIGKTGDDPIGMLVRNFLSEHGSCDCITDPDVSTAYTIALAIPGNDRIFLCNPGANDAFCSGDIPDSVLDDAAIFHFGYPPLMKSMYENGGDELVKLYRRVKERGIPTSLDMVFVDPNSEAGQADWAGILERVLPYVDYFVPSFEETLFMLDREKYFAMSKPGKDMTENIDFVNDVKPLADRLFKMGPKSVVIKCGCSGMYYKTADEEGIQKAFKVEKVCSATGAGDVSIAAFLCALLEKRPFRECVALAAAEGACSVTAYDSFSGVRTLSELEKLIDGTEVI